MTHSRTTQTLLALAAALALLLVAYLPALQTIPNGSENYYMIDVGETQVVLNKFGTLHATGYPLYVMIGGTLVALLRAFGVDAATAPAVVSLFWGLIALTLIYALAVKLTHRPYLAAGMTVLYGLTRTVWIHNDIAEIYTMTLCLLLLLLIVALWRPPIPGRVFWLALIGGIAVAHHRALIMAAPALIVAVYADLKALLRRRPLLIFALLGLGLLGLLPYAYLYLRAVTGAAWVYGEPGTLQGLIDQFMGREASRFIGLPGSLDALIANVNLVNSVIITDLTVPGVLVGIVGLIIGLTAPRTRRAALVLIISGGAAYLFHALFYSDILSALILAVTLSLAFGWLFLADALLPAIAPAIRSITPSRQRSLTAIASLPLPTERASGGEVVRTSHSRKQPFLIIVLTVIAVAYAGYLYNENAPFITSLTEDPTGLQTITLAQHTPPGATLMLAWGPRYFAVGFARDVLGLLPGMRLVTHKADYRALLQQGPLVTPAYTFYNQPVSWWEKQIGQRVYLHAVAPDLVQIATQPELEVDPNSDQAGVAETAHRVDCMPDTIVLRVAWHAEDHPQRDLSVFVHLLDANGSVIAQDDHSAPVYGWRPLTTWDAEEVVRDVYSLPRLPNAARISYGLYTQHADGSFEDVVEYSLPVECY